jgi:NADH pyrophosphatase NudC (nudix superfamily)
VVEHRILSIRIAKEYLLPLGGEIPPFLKDKAMAEIQDVMDKLEDVLDKLVDNLEAINVPRSVQRFCHHCGGDGNKMIGEELGTCPDCGGDGYSRFGRITLTSDE